MVRLTRSRPRASTSPNGIPAPWGWALTGALTGLLLILLFQAPARWLTGALQQASLGRLVFQGARGTVWSGSTKLTLTGGAGSQAAATLPGRVSWLIQPAPNGLQVKLQADCCMQQAWRLNLIPSWSGAQLVLADSVSQWPAQWLTGLGTPWNTVQIEGQLALATQGLSLRWAGGRMAMAGRLQLDADNISSRLSTLRPMGSYRATIQGGAAPSLELETREGRLQLSGTGQWAGARFRFDGVASAAPEHQDALSNLLNIIGRRDGARAIIKVG